MGGAIATFYSYKGGVGRSFALANVAVILAQWGLRVLAVDWDIEAPGLHHYFQPLRSSKSHGVLDFLRDCRDGSPRHWSKYVQSISLPDCPGTLSLMPAAFGDEDDYTRAVQELNWDRLFSDCNLGGHLETLRASWIGAFDFVLVDSRTGVTDFSGITTVQLPDYLVFFFTANHQSLSGCCDIARRAMKARKDLPVDRAALIPIPIPAKFELREEYDRANTWRKHFAASLDEFFQIWKPKQVETAHLIDNLIIPYVPRWSFGEDLAALIEPAATNGTRSASFPVTFTIETIAGLLASKLERVDLFTVSRDEFVLTARASAYALRAKTASDRPKVFLSYRYDDRGSVIDMLVQELEHSGLSVSIDRALITERDFRSEITSEITKNASQADALVVVVGKEVSRWQNAEVEAFVRSGLRSTGERPILPIVLPGARHSLRELKFVSSAQAQEIDFGKELRPQLAAASFELSRMLGATALRRATEVQRDLLALSIKTAEEVFERGNLPAALESYRESLAIAERLAKSDPERPEWQSNLAVLQNKIADVLVAQGDLAAALRSFRDGFAIVEGLARADPDNAVWQRDLSASLNKIADVLAAQGDFAGALKSYRRSLAISKRLVHADPGNAAWQRDLSVSFNRIADVLMAQGDLVGALKSYRESLAIFERLAHADPANAAWQRDLSVSFDRIADVLVAQGDLAGALESYRDSLAIFQRLTHADPANAAWQRDLSVTLNQIGNVLAAQGELGEALQSYRNSLAILEKLAKTDPSNASWQRDLAHSLANVGSFSRRNGDVESALSNYHQALSIYRRLLASNPSDASLRREMSTFLSDMGDLYRSRGEEQVAQQAYRESLSVREHVASISA
jgi:tetratricopeptide (TPR) repeat protein/MinD-like ATPase involved in chromosome partitioning or flagellar assembly